MLRRDAGDQLRLIARCEIAERLLGSGGCGGAAPQKRGTNEATVTAILLVNGKPSDNRRTRTTVCGEPLTAMSFASQPIIPSLRGDGAILLDFTGGCKRETLGGLAVAQSPWRKAQSAGRVRGVRWVRLRNAPCALRFARTSLHLRAFYPRLDPVGAEAGAGGHADVLLRHVARDAVAAGLHRACMLGGCSGVWQEAQIVL